MSGLNSRTRVRAVLATIGNNPPYSLPAVPQSVFWIDPRNRTGLASDGNTGLTPTAPLLTWQRGVLPRLGLFPVLRTPQAPLAFNFMSSSPADGSDPVTLSPTSSAVYPTGAPIRFSGFFDAHNIVGSGALAGVLAKNRVTGQVLTANLSAVTGAAVGQVLTNTTPGKESRCFLVANLGGGVFKLSQPLTISDDWPLSVPAEVDSYANGDTFTLHNEDLIDLVRLSMTGGLFDNSIDPRGNEFCVVTNLGVLNPGAPTNNTLYLFDTTTFVCSWVQRRVVVQPAAFGRNVIFLNCFGSGAKGGGPDIQGESSLLFLFGGAWGPMDAAAAALDQDVILLSPFTRLLQGSLIGAVCVDTGTVAQISGEVLLTDQGNGAALWGSGSLNVTFGRLFLSGTTATASLLLSGGITINGQSFAFTATRVNPSVINGNVAVTPANIDANASGMFQPGGGAIANFG
jgi:hypothetical protein